MTVEFRKTRMMISGIKNPRRRRRRTEVAYGRIKSAATTSHRLQQIVPSIVSLIQSPMRIIYQRPSPSLSITAPYHLLPVILHSRKTSLWLCTIIPFNPSHWTVRPHQRKRRRAVYRAGSLTHGVIGYWRWALAQRFYHD